MDEVEEGTGSAKVSMYGALAVKAESTDAFGSAVASRALVAQQRCTFVHLPRSFAYCWPDK